MGCDFLLHGLYFPKHNFNPRTPCGVRPVRHGERHLCAAISIHAPLAGCDLPQDAPVIFEGISIHAPLAGCDAALRVDSCMCSNFNPRTPCGVRPADLPKAHAEAQFQSTHPLRGATLVSPPALLALCISIHAPLAGCDPPGLPGQAVGEISIHAPLAGCDVAAFHASARDADFNPRTPCGVRLPALTDQAVMARFQSTHPLRGATALLKEIEQGFAISIHAPLAGCDDELRVKKHDPVYFNPRTPCGVRPACSKRKADILKFQSTHPLRGATSRALI